MPPPAGRVMLLAAAAALVVGALMYLSLVAAPTGPLCLLGGPGWAGWSNGLSQQAAVHQVLSADAAGIRTARLEGSAAETAVRMEPGTAAELAGVAADAMSRVGWRAGIRFASFDATATLEGVLADPMRHTGAFLLIVPGSGGLERRTEGQPFLSVDTTAAGGHLGAALGPAAAALEAMISAAEAALGRRLFAFRLETAPLPPCAAGTGPCAVWEASSGRVVLDAGLAATMAGISGTAGAAGAPAELAGPEQAASTSAGLPQLLAGFVGKLAEQLEPAVALLQDEQVSLPSLAALFSKGGAAAVTLLMVAQVPLWWCIACPLVLGMLAPFLFNFGLTAAAEALCAQLQLPDQTCTDLWWGAFALALVLSLGAAVPIVYFCRLPECGRHAAAVAAAGGAATVRMLAK